MTKKSKNIRRKSKATRKRGGKRINADLWGYHAVREAWLNPARKIHALYLTDNTYRGFKDTFEEAKAEGINRPEPEILNKKAFEKRLPSTVHQGIALTCDPLPEVFVPGLIARTSLKDSGLLVVLDQVTDPYNVGAVLRSIAAFGGDGLIMQTRHSPGITGVLAKSACGAVEHVPIAYETNLSRAIEQLQDAGYSALALDERGQTVISKATPHKKTVLVLGAEGKGLRPSIAEQCNELVRLPTTGAIRSLNVSNAAAVSLYALKNVSL